MNREEAAEFTRKLLETAEINASPGKPKRINNIPVFYFEAVLSALCGPQPDPDTGLVPCGCGGKATRSYSSIGCVVFCSTCGCTTKSVFFASEAVKVWNTAMGWKGGAE